jgi:hypothetical protein
MMFPEENTELEKQIGCMAGIFQMFDRGHLFTGRRFNRHGQKRLTSGTFIISLISTVLIFKSFSAFRKKNPFYVIF